MNRIDMNKRIALKAKRPEGTYLGKLKGMRVYLEGEVGDEVIFIQVYENLNLGDGKYQLIADLNLFNGNAKGAYHVDLMRVDYRYQGHGLAPLVYRYVLRKLGIVIQAGKCQSAGGRKLWAQLAKMGGVIVYALHRRGTEAHTFDIDDDADELSHEAFKVYDGQRSVYTFAVAE